ncbi:light-harvesting complex-like protein 3 isotype 1, chloroplastic [Magnolia sinica]|uniref:light-harvesting complex-like protein 3 isotype 1, chloroplastic n=1 Tax=Magnolia sinica TaxID=86752 RepID=UPI002659182F|nr:light-harvesting complex-like protein 3 isotype 1, chloroplastic [Magnolia sinica]
MTALTREEDKLVHFLAWALDDSYPSYLLAQQGGKQASRKKKHTSSKTPSMASIAIFASLQTACSSHHVIKKQQPAVSPRGSFGAKQATHVVSMDVEDQKTLLGGKEQEKTATGNIGLEGIEGERMHGMEKKSSSVPMFKDERWRNGSWDLNMFVKDGKMDWDAMIVAEATRRKFLQLYPEPATNQAPVLFRSSIIPWWAWLRRFHLPEAELLNGRAAMLGFFMAYSVDGLTGLGVVGQTSNFICKAFLFATVTGIILFRQNQDFSNLRKLIEEATFYDKQWQSTWQDHKASNTLKQDQEPK